MFYALVVIQPLRCLNHIWRKINKINNLTIIDSMYFINIF